MPSQRALILLRLSRMTDATTSPERQEADCRRYCAAHGLDVVDVASDTDVSGSVDPLDRPALGLWLHHRLDEFDVVVASKLDRVGRNASHIHELMKYLQANDKSLECANDKVDISSAMGRMIVYIMSTVAEMELAEISRRNSSAAAYNIARGTFRGGTIPAGYKPEKDSAGDWRLVPDEDGLAPVIRDVVARLAEGERPSAVIADLVERKVPTPKDRQDELAGRTPKGRTWRVANFRTLVTSPTIIGQSVYRETVTDVNGNPVKKNGRKQYGPERVVFKDGEPLIRAEPLVDPALFYAAKSTFRERDPGKNGTRRAKVNALLTGVLFCARCGAKMYRNVRKDRRNLYHCNSGQQGKHCGNGTVAVDLIDQAVIDYLMGALGPIPHIRREYVHGTDSNSTIESIDAELQSYTAAVGRFPVGSPSWEEMMRKVDLLTAKRAELAAQPSAPSGWQYVKTGVTYAEYWDALDTVARNDFLRDHNVRIEMSRDRGTKPTWTIDVGDILGMIEKVNPQVAEVTRKFIEDRKAGKPMPKPSPEILEAGERYVGVGSGRVARDNVLQGRSMFGG